MLCFIMRGLPGSGKSHIASHMLQQMPDAIVCSADDYRMVNGEYVHSKDGNADAHAKCFAKFLDAIRAKKVVIIDNTNVKRWEFERYVDEATKAGYAVAFVTPGTAWANDPGECARRGTHNVPLAAIEGMKAQYST